MMKDRHSRRGFLSLTGAGIAGVVSGPLLGGAAAAQTQGVDLKTQDADLVVFNAKVYTVDSRTPKVEAFYWAAITFSQTLGTALGD